ncbi:hypothetical protein HV832_14310 [Undibacterium oligocarboniphilum]|uniref:Uncharacterized protein n=2 Tax=Undibacterium oligocarboniphilum TaxID=666702 RepID=A0A850QQE8_9BURK|nr:hypothetical protein [Undibacterium oligocarboniphilum]NVO79000.1 hypothetical protein [Undibacterium oligocarboniphilum]
MTILKALGIYFGLLIGFFVLVELSFAFTWFPGIIPLVSYFVCGFVLNRIVLRGLVEWHPVHNTVENVSSGKLNFLIFWPFAYPVLFFKLSVVKHL